MLESGLRAIAVIFFRFSNGKVYDLLLRFMVCKTSSTTEHNSLYKIEYGDPIAHRAKDTVPIWCEEDIALSIDGATQIGKLKQM